MSAPKRVFYVVYSKDEGRQRILDAICFLADPNEKSRAHVTLRGPYDQRRHFPSTGRLVEDAQIDITGIDAFFRAGQNTVFFEVKAPQLEGSWYKPDFPKYRPHLTIYDGPSRAFAERLRRRLAEIDPHFQFRATALEPLITQKGQGSMDLRSAFDEDLVREITGKDISAEDVNDISDDERIDLITELCTKLVSHGIQTEGEKSRSRRRSL
jgi:hypothetical protein